MGVVLFSTRAKYSSVFLGILGFPVALLLGVSAIMFFHYKSVFAMSVCAFFAASILIAYLIALPRSFQIRTDAVVIKLGTTIIVPLSHIATVSRSETNFRLGSLHLVTSLSHCVYLQRFGSRGILFRFDSFSNLHSLTQS
jgi:hypothetical protein